MALYCIFQIAINYAAGACPAKGLNFFIPIILPLNAFLVFLSI